MSCNNNVRENLMDLLSGEMANPELAAHVKECGECARELESLRKTMALLDEWEAPAPTPYFLTRLQAHVREEQQKQPQGWLSWLRRPVLTGALAIALMTGGALYLGHIPGINDNNEPPKIGSAVSDLSNLDDDHDLYVNSDLLEELTGGPSDDVSD